MSQYKSVADTENTGSALQALKKRIEERVEVRKKKGLSSSRSISLYCKKLLQPLTELQNSKNILMKNYSNIAQMQFDKFSANLHLPSGEQCIISANLSMRRADMEQSNNHCSAEKLRAHIPAEQHCSGTEFRRSGKSFFRYRMECSICL